MKRIFIYILGLNFVFLVIFSKLQTPIKREIRDFFSETSDQIKTQSLIKMCLIHKLKPIAIAEIHKLINMEKLFYY